MKIMFEDDENTKTICEVICIDNGVTYIELDDDNGIELPNVVRFTLANNDCVYIIVDEKEGNEIVSDAYNCDKLDLSSYKSSTIFYPEKEDLEYIESIAKTIFESNYESIVNDKEYHSNQYGLYEY